MLIGNGSNVEPLRQGLPGSGYWQGECAAVVHGRQAEDSGEYHEGDQDGACVEEGSDQGEALDTLFCVLHFAILYR